MYYPLETVVTTHVTMVYILYYVKRISPHFILFVEVAFTVNKVRDPCYRNILDG